MAGILRNSWRQALDLYSSTEKSQSETPPAGWIDTPAFVCFIIMALALHLSALYMTFSRVGLAFLVFEMGLVIFFWMSVGSAFSLKIFGTREPKKEAGAFFVLDGKQGLKNWI